jgi:hypothetical protein
VTEFPEAGGTCSATAADYFPPEVEQMLTTAMQAIDAHINDHGSCAGCHMSWPCATAVLAEHNLAAL